MKTSIVVVSIALAAAILLSVSRLVARDPRREGALDEPAGGPAANPQPASFHGAPPEETGRI